MITLKQKVRDHLTQLIRSNLIVRESQHFRFSIHSASKSVTSPSFFLKKISSSNLAIIPAVIYNYLRSSLVGIENVRGFQTFQTTL